MKLKLSELIKAYQAMDTIVELPVRTVPNIDQWSALMYARNYLLVYLESLDVQLEVHDDTV